MPFLSGGRLQVATTQLANRKGDGHPALSLARYWFFVHLELFALSLIIVLAGREETVSLKPVLRCFGLFLVFQAPGWLVDREYACPEALCVCLPGLS